MTLNSFLIALETPNVKVVVKDSQEKDICKITAESVTALDDTIEQRSINRWYINGATSITVFLNDATVSA